MPREEFGDLPLTHKVSTGLGGRSLQAPPLVLDPEGLKTTCKPSRWLHPHLSRQALRSLVEEGSQVGFREGVDSLGQVYVLVGGRAVGCRGPLSSLRDPVRMGSRLPQPAAVAGKPLFLPRGPRSSPPPASLQAPHLLHKPTLSTPGSERELQRCLLPAGGWKCPR